MVASTTVRKFKEFDIHPGHTDRGVQAYISGPHSRSKETLGIHVYKSAGPDDNCRYMWRAYIDGSMHADGSLVQASGSLIGACFTAWFLANKEPFLRGVSHPVSFVISGDRPHPKQIEYRQKKLQQLQLVT